MPINPNIAMAFRPAVELQQTDPLRDYAALAQIQQSQVQNQLARQQLEQKQGALNYLRGNPDLSTPEGLKGLRQFGDVGLSYEKLVTDQATNALKRQELEGKLRDQRMTALGTGLTSVMNDPSDEKLMSAFDNLEATGVKVGDLRTRLLGMPLDQRMAEIKQYVTTHPEGRQALAFVQPKPEKVDLHGKIVVLDMNPNSPTYQQQVQEFRKTMTPYEKEHLAVQQGQLKVAQDRLAKEGAGLDPNENAAISKAIIEGRLDPNRVNGRNAKILATTLLANPEVNVLELGVAAAGATAAERSLATQTAKMSTAANEANKMVGVVRDLSDKVDRTEFPTLNAISNAVAKGTGSKEIVQLNTSINALVNSYARAISPTGAPTVSDKNHAREVINSAYSQGQLGAILDVMQQEMSISREAAGTAGSELKQAREKERGRSANQRPTGVGNDWTFMTDAKGNKAWVSPDKKNFVEVK